MRYLVVIFILFSALLAEAEDNKNKEDGQFNLTGKESILEFNAAKYNLLEQAEQETEKKLQAEYDHKSGIKAALLSAVLPGAGEAYTKSWWRAALFAGLEIALWTTNIYYENKGDDEDKKMRSFGNEHWSEHKYWSKLYYEAYQKAQSDPTLAQKLPDYGFDDNDPNKLLSNFNNDMANSLRDIDLEKELGYTHSLPGTTTQQYYEMIYKYLHQFGVGWDDVIEVFNDPFYYDNIGTLNNLTPHIDSYRSMRNTSNDYYETATTMINLVLVNHVLSALDAAISAKQYNKKIHYSFRVRKQRVGYESIYTYGVRIIW